MNKITHALLGFLALLMISALVFAGLTNQPQVGVLATVGLFCFGSGFCYGADSAGGKDRRMSRIRSLG